MADGVTLEIDTRELEAALKALPKKVAKAKLQKALQLGGEVILEAMIANAPERTDEPTPDGDSLPPGVLKADLHTQVSSHEDGGSIKIGPSTITGHVARWVNNGWALTGHKPGKKQIKEIPGKHFIERAFDESAEKAVNAFLTALSASLENK
jgi:HK97 gp10 family phage protein